MDAMPRPRPPYLSREVTRHGRVVWYVRRNGKAASASAGRFRHPRISKPSIKQPWPAHRAIQSAPRRHIRMAH